MSQVVPQACRGALSLAALALALGFGPATARAEPIAYKFHGLVTQSTNADVVQGAEFTGTLHFDSSLPTLGTTTPTEATYGYNAAGVLKDLKAHADFGGGQTFDSTKGGPRTLTIDNNASIQNFLSVNGTQSLDKVTFSSSNGAGAATFTMSLADNTAKVLSSTDLGALPDLSNFPSSGSFVHLQGAGGDIFGYITKLSNISPASETLSVPEPSSLAIVGLGMAGLAAARRRRAFRAA